VKPNSTNFAFSTATGNAISIADGDAGTNPLRVESLSCACYAAISASFSAAAS
jgi:hypothetical protein